jgi:ABC-type uncharacterized transport system permease subunit
MQAALLWAALVFYAFGIAMTVPSVIRRRPTLSPSTLAAVGFGLLLHASALALAGAQIRRLPLTDVCSALSFFSFLATLAFFLVYLRYRMAALGLFMLPLVFVLTMISALHPERPLANPAFRGGWLLIHIGSSILGYTAFFLTFVAALMYLFQERELKSRRPRALYYRLPSLEVCDELYSRSLLLGLPFLSLGILTGFVSASRMWKGPWELDPKILASLVTWLIYLVLFSTRLSGAYRGRRSAYLAIFGFVAILATFLGISLWSGQHGYVPELGRLP